MCHQFGKRAEEITLHSMLKSGPKQAAASYGKLEKKKKGERVANKFAPFAIGKYEPTYSRGGSVNQLSLLIIYHAFHKVPAWKLSRLQVD